MGWESENDQGQEKEPRDWGKVIWIGVIGMFIAMIVALALQPRESVAVSKVRVKQILIQADVNDPKNKAAGMEKIAQIQKLLDEGESFETVAEEWSEDAGTASAGGSLGWVMREELISPIDRYIWTGPIGKVSDPIESTYGIHLVLIVDRKITDAELYERELQERVGNKAADTP
jgi:parvulin-like peptidyl-prolyl isomerase